MIKNPNEHGLGTLAEPYHPPSEEVKETTASEDEGDTSEPDSDVSQRTPILQRRAISTREYGLFIETELHQEVEQITSQLKLTDISRSQKRRREEQLELEQALTKFTTMTTLVQTQVQAEQTPRGTLRIPKIPRKTLPYKQPSSQSPYLPHKEEEAEEEEEEAVEEEEAAEEEEDQGYLNNQWWQPCNKQDKQGV